MYSKEQREKALALYDKCHSVTKVMQSLGYPESRAGLYPWLKQRNAPPKKKAERKQINNVPNHPLHPSLETKLVILHRCFIEGEKGVRIPSSHFNNRFFIKQFLLKRQANKKNLRLFAQPQVFSYILRWLSGLS